MLDPKVIVQPFESKTENVVSNPITPTDYFTPSSVALLLQHLALTFAGRSIVCDRRTGCRTDAGGPRRRSRSSSARRSPPARGARRRSRPARPGARAGVPIAGDWMARRITVGVLLVAGARHGLRSCPRPRARRSSTPCSPSWPASSSAVILPIDGLSYPIKAISWLLPVTYGIAAGLHHAAETTPDHAAAAWGFGARLRLLAVIGLRRRLRTSSE